MSQEVLLSVKDLRTEFFSSKTSSVTAIKDVSFDMYRGEAVSYTHLRAHETEADLVCRLLLEKIFF